MSKSYASKGQSLVIFALLAVFIVAAIGLAVDGANWVFENLHARGTVRNACLFAANTQFDGGNATVAFYQVMAANQIPDTGYIPTSGGGTGLVRGISFEGTSLRTAVRYDVDTYLIRVIGINTVPVDQHARCTTTGGLITPIAVKYSAWNLSYNPPKKDIDVLGKGSEADIDSGKNYRGAVYPFMHCVKNGTNVPDPNCEDQIIFPPLTVDPPSPQTAKDAIAKCWSGKFCNNIFAPVNTRLPTVSGTSNAMLVKAAVDAGLTVGKEFIAIIYDGTVTSPDPTYGNWENVAVLGYGYFVVTKVSANSITAKAISPILSPLELRYYKGKFLYPVEIPWNAQGGW